MDDFTDSSTDSNAHNPQGGLNSNDKSTNPQPSSGPAPVGPQSQSVNNQTQSSNQPGGTDQGRDSDNKPEFVHFNNPGSTNQPPPNQVVQPETNQPPPNQPSPANVSDNSSLPQSQPNSPPGLNQPRPQQGARKIGGFNQGGPAVGPWAGQGSVSPSQPPNRPRISDIRSQSSQNYDGNTNPENGDYPTEPFNLGQSSRQTKIKPIDPNQDQQRSSQINADRNLIDNTNFDPIRPSTSQPQNIGETRPSKPPDEPQSFTKAVRGETATGTRNDDLVRIETPQHKKNLEIFGERGSKRPIQKLRHPYSHSDQLKKKRQVSGLIVNVLMLVLFSGIITGSYIMWPQIGALIEKFRLDENKLLVKLVDEMFQQSSQQYNITISGDQWQADSGLKEAVGFEDNSGHHFGVEGKLKVDQNNPLTVSGKSDDGIQVTIYGKKDEEDAPTLLNLKYNTFQQSDTLYVKLNDIKLEEIDDEARWMQYEEPSKTPTNFDKLLKNLLIDYNYWNYSLILPSVRIEDEDTRQAMVLSIKSAYTITNCDPSLREQTSYTTCDLEINYEKLYSSYKHLYTHFHSSDPPDYYDVIRDLSQNEDVWLPNKFKIKINRLTNLPVTLYTEREGDQTEIRIEYLGFVGNIDSVERLTGLLQDSEKKSLIEAGNKKYFREESD